MPAPFTTDWGAARRSVEILADLVPNTVAAGHGQPINGAQTAEKLIHFALNFKAPVHGRDGEQPTKTASSRRRRSPIRCGRS